MKPRLRNMRPLSAPPKPRPVLVEAGQLLQYLAMCERAAVEAEQGELDFIKRAEHRGAQRAFRAVAAGLRSAVEQKAKLQ
jgi:hypothetical protein